MRSVVAKPGLESHEMIIPVMPARSRLARIARFEDDPDISRLKVQFFAVGADVEGMVELAGRGYIAGLATNPTLMRKAGVTDYRAFALDVLKRVASKPISFEVFSDDFDEMERQAMQIRSWGENAYVKVPATNPRAEPAYDLIRRLAAAGVKQNVTALMTPQQVREASAALGDRVPAYVSVPAGRIADTGRDPLPMMIEALRTLRPFPNQRLIWESPRELLNIFQADAIGCHVITVNDDVLKKLALVGRDLSDYSLETVRMFHDEASAAGFEIQDT